MPYTLWSRGRLLGESDLGFVQIWENVKFGWFYPSPFGEKMMPVLTGSGPALIKLGKMLRNPIRAMMRSAADSPKGEWPADIRRTTAYADLIAIQDELAAMEIELRDADGHVVEVEDIGLDDMAQKIARLPKKHRGSPEEVQAAFEDRDRYQIQVHLRGVPRRRLHVPGLDD